MSWQEGATYIIGMILIAVGVGIRNGIDSAFIALGIALMALAIIGEWNE